MRKILSIAVLTFFLSTQTSQAFAPVAIPVWYYGAGALAVGGGAGVYCAMKSGVASTVDVAGNLSRKAGVAWVALSTANLPVLHEGNVTAHKTFSQIAAAVNGSPSLYSKLKSALQSISNGSVPTSAAPLAAGNNIIHSNSQLYAITRVASGTVTNSWNQSGYINLGGTSWRYTVLGANGSASPTTKTYTDYFYSSITPIAPVYAPSTPSQFVKSIAVSETGGDVNTEYQAELDMALQDSTYIPTFTDDTTGLPLTYPSDPLSPAALSAVNAQGVASDEREQALVAAQQAAASAVAAKDAAVSAANADPTNTALAQKAADATAAASAATASAQKVAAENATTAAQEAANEAAKESAVGITIPAVKSFSWARFADLKGSLAATFPFYLIPKIGDLMGQIAPETPTPPVFTLPVYGKTYQISLEMFDPIASALRDFIAVIASIACIIMMVKFYRGTS